MTWVLENLPRIGELTLAHLALSLPAVVIAFVLSIPLAWGANRVRVLREPVLTGTGLLYAVPSLPLFILLPALIGTSVRDPLNVVIALSIFGLALMVRSAAEALDAVTADVRTSATAIGFSGVGRFFTVELPLAGPALLAGVRVVCVSSISLVSVSAVLGVSSLGSLFTDGFARNIIGSIVAGIVMTVVLALICDLLLVLAGRMLMPWQQTSRRRRPLPTRAREVAA
ncbi:ABC transporter permease [Nesterenkonia sandarakina]|uniref:Osmoprotectant transport system permease protein n=1 Tax=Nesterenkonia sandarakina TaxID=272918 RepID=A0A2T0YIM0_9MICC|nr:ABC transporter permease subunit [Nesterenkonia sandarakina]PRZ14991.1 osmoprotectant transport system permease protein [Nesterenkonia sandarakina]